MALIRGLLIEYLREVWHVDEDGLLTNKTPDTIFLRIHSLRAGRDNI